MQNSQHDFSEPLIQLSQYVRAMTDLLNERRYEDAMHVALDATVAVYKVYDFARGQVRK